MRARSQGLSGRVHVVAGDARLAVGALIGVLMVLIGVVVLASLVASGHTGDSGGLVFLVLLVGAGAYVVVSALRQAGSETEGHELVAPAPRDLVPPDPSGLYGPPMPVVRPRERDPARRVVGVLAAVLALLVVVPLVIALVFSVLDDHLRGRGVLARLVLLVVVLVTTLGIRLLLRRIMTAPRTDPGRDDDR